MAFTTFEELKQAAYERTQDVLTLELDMSGEYSHEYEEAKQDLETRKAIQSVMGTQFMSDIQTRDSETVEALRPRGEPIYLKFRRLSTKSWAKMMSASGANVDVMGQYHKMLPEIFIGIYGDPHGEPLTTEWKYVSAGPDSLLTGSMIAQVVSSVIRWQNSGGGVTVNPH